MYIQESEHPLMLEVLSIKEMIEAEHLTISGGVPDYELMENAGSAVTHEVLIHYKSVENIVVLCGPGSNGGDGFVAACQLRQKGYRVSVALLGSREGLTGVVAKMASRWTGALKPFQTDILKQADLIVDAIFGSGLSRDVSGEAARMIDAVNESNAAVLCVDTPSGIDGTSGQVRGTAVKADRTVTFFRLKSGHLLLPGRAFCGEIAIANIGIKDAVLEKIAPQLLVNEPQSWLRKIPLPSVDSHKYRRGHSLVVSGGTGKTGAARLGARAALRMGSGAVTLASPTSAMIENAAQLTAVMIENCDNEAALADCIKQRRISGVLIGPGGGVGGKTRNDVIAALESQAAVILDADALMSFRDGPQTLFFKIFKRTAPVILTPHAGEFARLFDDRIKAGSKLEQARLASAQSGAIVILKGADTVIAAPDGRAAINRNAPPWLATAGSGDVLAGIVLGLITSGMEAFSASCAAVWIHGQAAEHFGAGLIAEDLADLLPGVVQDLFARASGRDARLGNG